MRLLQAFTFIALIVFVSSFVPQGTLSKIQLDMDMKSLHNNKVVSFKGKIYYRHANGQMVTRFTYPREIITITNAQGEFKNFNVKENTVTQIQGRDFSSKESFIYMFFSGRTRDMGLRDAGFKLSDTKIEDKMVITKWSAPVIDQEISGNSVELVHENFLPIYMGVYQNNMIVSKVYYSDYQNIGGLGMPLRITEINYLNPEQTDSIIVRKQYSSPLINEQVDNAYLNFEIPKDAKLIKSEREF
jgi:hypothetical protein